MPRKPRKSFNVSYFHIITQGINKTFIFNNSVDIKYYIKLLYSIKADYSIKIISYCIMNNHTHMLVKVKSISELSDYMHRVNTSYALYFNKKYKRVGPVFRDRFKSQPIYTESQFYNCINYIFNNPVKAGICSIPSKYPYSNYFKINNLIPEYYNFIENDEDNTSLCHELVEQFLSIYNITKEDLKKNKVILKKLVLITKLKHGISFRKLADELGISKDTIRKLSNEK